MLLLLTLIATRARDDLPLPICGGYCWFVPRSRASRLVSLALLLLAGSVEPAWEIGHAIAHARVAHPHPEQPALESGTANPTFALTGLPDADDHPHLVLQAPVRPSSSPLALVVAALPSTSIRPLVPSLVVPRHSFPGVTARASPPYNGGPQTRAPPLI